MRCRADKICAAAGALMEDAYRSAAPHARSLSITSLQAMARHCDQEAQALQEQCQSPMLQEDVGGDTAAPRQQQQPHGALWPKGKGRTWSRRCSRRRSRRTW